MVAVVLTADRCRHDDVAEQLAVLGWDLSDALGVPLHTYHPAVSGTLDGFDDVIPQQAVSRRAQTGSQR